MGPGARGEQRRLAAGGGFHNGHAVGVVGAGVDVPWGVGVPRVETIILIGFRIIFVDVRGFSLIFMDVHGSS